MNTKNGYENNECKKMVTVQLFRGKIKVLGKLFVEIPLEIKGHFAQYKTVKESVQKNIPYDTYSHFTWK